MTASRLLLLSLAVSLASCQLDIQLVNNGYENVLVAISDTVAYDTQIIPRIQELLNNASATLFKATNYRAYFREVTILVPTRWNVPSAQPATMQSFDKAHIRVDKPSSSDDDNPWVQQVGECGVPGQFMHITPKFLLDEDKSIREWGSLEKVFVHEWGHLRWGLFDEYPIGDEVTEHFYHSPTTNTIEPSRCNINVKGKMKHLLTGADCKIDLMTSLPEADCRYYPDRRQTKTRASLMCYHFLPSIEGFCGDDDLSYDTVHNQEAPSRHNRLCSGRSSWSVMGDSPDFKNGNNEAADDSGKDTRVTFKLVQRRESRVVVVMDTSGSMEGNNNYVKLNAAVRRYLLYTVPTGASVGLVKYSSDATAITPALVKVDSVAKRKQLANLVPLQFRGNTAIGLGLRLAKVLLGNVVTATKGSRIILLTDGEENIIPNVSEVLPELTAAGIIVDTILLTPNASNILISLAAQTGGLSFYSSGDSKSTSLTDAFTTAERARLSDPRDVPVTIDSRVVSVAGKERTCSNVTIDSALGRDTTLTFSWVRSNNLQVIVTNGNGTHTAALENRNKAASYKCPGECIAGTWNICINNSKSSTENVVLQVESAATSLSSKSNSDNDDSEEARLPITVRTTIVNKEPSFDSENYKPVSLYATVSSGYSPVVRAQVVANIEYPKAGSQKEKTKLMMRDDGAGADIERADGTYSAFIVNSHVKGKHSISIEVSNGNETNIKTVKLISSRAGTISEPGDAVDRQEVELTPTSDFQRFSLAGYINVQSVAPPGIDKLPPSRIKDLKVTETSFDNRTVAFEWTAVGDDLDEGNAASYELWKADSFAAMYKAREQNATIIRNPTILEGNLSSPLSAYSRERLVITLPDLASTLVFAIIVRDKANNPSELSNVVSVKLEPEPEPKPPSNVGMIAGIVVGVLLLVIIVVVVVVVVVCRRVKGSGRYDVSKHLEQ